MKSQAVLLLALGASIDRAYLDRRIGEETGGDANLVTLEAGLVKKIFLEEHERQLAERKKKLGLSGRDYVPKNDGARRSAEKRLSWKS